MAQPTPGFSPPGPGQWMLDTTHHGRRPATRFMRSIAERSGDGFATFTARYGLPLQTMAFSEVNGYTYVRPTAIGDNGKGGPPPPRPIMWLLARLHPELRRRNRTAREAWAERRWRDDVDAWFENGGRAQVLAENLRFQEFDPSEARDLQLADHIGQLAAYLAEQFNLGFATHGGDIIPCGDYLAHCASWGIDIPTATGLLAGASAPTVEVRELLEPAALAIERLRQLNERPRSIADLSEQDPNAGAAIERWLELHGWRLLNSDDVDCPTLHEQPNLQWRILQSLTLADRAPAPDSSGVSARIPASGRPLFNELLAEARYGLRLRDDNVGLRLNWPAGLARRALHEIGQRLTKRGSLADPIHAMHCSAEELAALLRDESGPSADEINRRHDERQFQLSLSAPDHLGDAEPAPPVDAFPEPMARATRAVLALIDSMQGQPPGSQNTGAALAGEGIGTEPYTGRAVVIPGPDADFDAIRAGDVLVAPFTSPSFNSVFPLIGAVAVEEGGAMSHTAIVSREFGVPAVVGATGLLDAVTTGDELEVDPVAGTVHIR